MFYEKCPNFKSKKFHNVESFNKLGQNIRHNLEENDICKGDDCSKKTICNICGKRICQYIKGGFHFTQGHYQYYNGIVCQECHDKYGNHDCQRKLSEKENKSEKEN